MHTLTPMHVYCVDIHTKYQLFNMLTDTTIFAHTYPFLRRVDLSDYSLWLCSAHQINSVLPSPLLHQREWYFKQKTSFGNTLNSKRIRECWNMPWSPHVAYFVNTLGYFLMITEKGFKVEYAVLVIILNICGHMILFLLERILFQIIYNRHTSWNKNFMKDVTVRQITMDGTSPSSMQITSFS